MAHFFIVQLFILSCLILVQNSQQLPSSQRQVLQQLRRHLEYPKQLDAWDHIKDMCYTPVSQAVTVTCEGDSVTELKIRGDRLVELKKFEGYALPDETLSKDFSIDSFVTTLSRLPGLRVVILVSLGIWGPLPDKIHRLALLEVLDLSSNFLYGSIPQKISNMGMLQTLTLDGNYFNETLPDWFNLMPNLTSLSLQKNKLTGFLPTSIGGVKALIDLSLSSNRLSGAIPDLSGLTSLNVLNLRDNELDSDIPALPTRLVTVLLNKNSLTGEIPPQFGDLKQLQHLDLSFNLLEGTPPEGLFSLPNIAYLNLASNMLSGSLPSHMSCSSNLGLVDVSTNRLTGSLPSCLTSNKIVVKLSGNCLSIEPQHQHEPAYCQDVHKKGTSSKAKDITLLVAVIGAVSLVVLLLLVVFLLLCRRNGKRATAKQRLLPKPVVDNGTSGLSTELLANARYISQSMKLGKQVLPTYRVFSLEEVKEATKNFDQSSYIGEGSLGKLYKGRLENGNFVAIRCLAVFKRYSIRNLKLRLDLLSKLRHPHLVCLLGHCIDSTPDDFGVNRVFLVYEYIPNGNLRDHLSERDLSKVLKWSDRLAILVCIGKAVHFLHTGLIPGFFNNGLKANSVLLDEHLVAKLSDYGLSIITEEIQKYEVRAEGQRSAQSKPLPNETLPLEDDVFLFGLILLEALVGPELNGREASFVNALATSAHIQEARKQILDPIVLGTSSPESLSIVISITNKCLSSEPSTRPSLEDVLWNLQYAAQIQGTAEVDQRSEVASQA